MARAFFVGVGFLLLVLIEVSQTARPPASINDVRQSSNPGRRRQMHLMMPPMGPSPFLAQAATPSPSFFLVDGDAAFDEDDDSRFNIAVPVRPNMAFSPEGQQQQQPMQQQGRQRPRQRPNNGRPMFMDSSEEMIMRPPSQGRRRPNSNNVPPASFREQERDPHFQNIPPTFFISDDPPFTHLIEMEPFPQPPPPPPPPQRQPQPHPQPQQRPSKPQTSSRPQSTKQHSSQTGQQRPPPSKSAEIRPHAPEPRPPAAASRPSQQQGNNARPRPETSPKSRPQEGRQITETHNRLPFQHQPPPPRFRPDFEEQHFRERPPMQQPHPSPPRPPMHHPPPQERPPPTMHHSPAQERPPMRHPQPPPERPPMRHPQPPPERPPMRHPTPPPHNRPERPHSRPQEPERPTPPHGRERPPQPRPPQPQSHERPTSRPSRPQKQQEEKHPRVPVLPSVLDSLTSASPELHVFIPGDPGRDYPLLDSIPRTAFNCRVHPPSAFVADVDTGCQVARVCREDGVMDSFLCPNGTLFDEESRFCNWWYRVPCGEGPTSPNQITNNQGRTVPSTNLRNTHSNDNNNDFRSRPNAGISSTTSAPLNTGLDSFFGSGQQHRPPPPPSSQDGHSPFPFRNEFPPLSQRPNEGPHFPNRGQPQDEEFFHGNLDDFFGGVPMHPEPPRPQPRPHPRPHPRPPPMPPTSSAPVLQITSTDVPSTPPPATFELDEAPTTPTLLPTTTRRLTPRPTLMITTRPRTTPREHPPTRPPKSRRPPTTFHPATVRQPFIEEPEEVLADSPELLPDIHNLGGFGQAVGVGHTESQVTSARPATRAPGRTRAPKTRPPTTSRPKFRQHTTLPAEFEPTNFDEPPHHNRGFSISDGQSPFQTFPQEGEFDPFFEDPILHQEEITTTTVPTTTARRKSKTRRPSSKRPTSTRRPSTTTKRTRTRSRTKNRSSTTTTTQPPVFSTTTRRSKSHRIRTTTQQPEVDLRTEQSDFGIQEAVSPVSIRQQEEPLARAVDHSAPPALNVFIPHDGPPIPISDNRPENQFVFTPHVSSAPPSFNPTQGERSPNIDFEPFFFGPAISRDPLPVSLDRLPEPGFPSHDTVLENPNTDPTNGFHFSSTPETGFREEVITTPIATSTTTTTTTTTPLPTTTPTTTTPSTTTKAARVKASGSRRVKLHRGNSTRSSSSSRSRTNKSRHHNTTVSTSAPPKMRIRISSTTLAPSNSRSRVSVNKNANTNTNTSSTTTRPRSRRPFRNRGTQRSRTRTTTAAPPDVAHDGGSTSEPIFATAKTRAELFPPRGRKNNFGQRGSSTAAEADVEVVPDTQAEGSELIATEAVATTTLATTTTTEAAATAAASNTSESST